MSLVRRISMLARLEIGIVGRTRGAGRAGSAVAASAYNLCARLDDGTRAYDFARKASEHVGGCVLLPTGAPQALAEPGALWRAAEAAERRADAQLARQMLITIPREVAAADRLAFACAVVAHYVADGAAAQVDVHCPGAADGGEQPHAHILLTLRRVSDAGLAATKCREWNQDFRADGGRAERARVATRATAWLHAHGIAQDYDLRSLADRGDDRPPEPSAPRADWQRWTREGADPEAAPATVAATLAHRGRRSALARVESVAAEAAAEIAALSDRLSATAGPAPEAVSGRTGVKARPPEEAYTPKADAAPTSIPPAQSGVAKKTAAAPTQRPDDYAACREAWRAEQRERKPDPRAALRAREKADRDRVYRSTRAGMVRAAGLAAVAKKHAAARLAVRAEALAAAWSATAQHETLDSWIARQAAAGHPAARAVHESRERAAAGRARRDPVGEAARRLAAWQAEARAGLAAAPPGADDVRSLAAAAAGRAAAKETAARTAAAATRQAVREHARRHGILGGLLVIGKSAVAEHRRLVAAAAAADRRVPYAQADRREEEMAVRLATKAAEKTAKAARRAWTTGAGAAASDRLAALDVLGRAVRAGDAAAVAAVLAGDERAAGRAAEAWQAAPLPVRTPARQVTAAPADPRTAALHTLARAETAAGRDPARLAAARAATAAAVAGNAATVAAAAAGDVTGAQRAAAEWQARQTAEADATERERRRRAEAARLAADRRGYAGPGR
jgi:hypothetical protein